MQIFIMRHGQASEYGESDALRPLTEQGILETTLMAKWMKKANIDFDQILVSPFLRAQQTAKTMAETLAAPIITLDFITPDGSAREVHDYLDGIGTLERVNNLLIVSHMPLVCYLVAELSAENEAPIFQTAAVAQIDYDTKRMKGHLTRLVSPSDLC